MIFVFIYYTELGDGYTPAIFYSQGEYKFMRVFVSKKWKSRSFWIGGSTNGNGPKGSIELFEYLTTSSGNNNYILVGSKTHYSWAISEVHINVESILNF